MASSSACVCLARAGFFEVCDFVLLLLVYATSHADTLKTFFHDLRPCKSLLPVVWARLRLPSRSALSRFLAAVTAPAVEALRTLLFEDLLAHGLTGPYVGGLVDRVAQRHVLFDVDGTHQVARQRQVVGGDERPPVRRRLAALCGRGYHGRHRGDVTRPLPGSVPPHRGPRPSRRLWSLPLSSHRLSSLPSCPVRESLRARTGCCGRMLPRRSFVGWPEWECTRIG